MLSKKQSSVYQNKSSSQHCALRGSDANFRANRRQTGRGSEVRADGSTCVRFRKLTAAARDTVISEILRNVATRLASYKDLEGLRALDELPRNALTKIGTWQTSVLSAYVRFAPILLQSPKSNDSENVAKTDV
jgi:hypothetical protein